MFSHSHCARAISCSNEVLAREGIDTEGPVCSADTFVSGSNEELAREGIDTELNDLQNTRFP